LVEQSALKCRGVSSAHGCTLLIGGYVIHVQSGPITIWPLFSEKNPYVDPSR
jgi:hypothetical protein